MLQVYLSSSNSAHNLKLEERCYFSLCKGLQKPFWCFRVHYSFHNRVPIGFLLDTNAEKYPDENCLHSSYVLITQTSSMLSMPEETKILLSPNNFYPLFMFFPCIFLQSLYLLLGTFFELFDTYGIESIYLRGLSGFL